MYIDFGLNLRGIGLTALVVLFGAGGVAAQQPTESQQADYHWTTSFHGTGEWADINAMAELLWTTGSTSLQKRSRSSSMPSRRGRSGTRKVLRISASRSGASWATTNTTFAMFAALRCCTTLASWVSRA